MGGGPVVRQTHRHLPQHMAGQIGHPQARQEQKARVVHHPAQIGNPGPITPAHITIPGRLIPAGQMEGQAPDTAQMGTVDPVTENRTRMAGCPPGVMGRQHGPQGPSPGCAVPEQNEPPNGCTKRTEPGMNGNG